MDVRHLQTFQSVLREGSFGRAARALGLAQPTVTLHVQELEEELGLTVFDRRGRQRQLTEAGELLAARALPILEALDSLGRSMAELKDGRGGLVRFGAIEPAASRIVTPLLARLRRQRPALRVRLDSSGTAGVSRAVADRDLDAGLCSEPSPDLDLRFEPLFDEDMALLLPRSHRLAKRRILQARHLDGEPMILSEQGCAYRAAVERALGERGVRPRWALESGSTATLQAAVQHGLGIGFLPARAADPAPPGTLVRRLSDLVVSLPVGLVTRRDSPPASPALGVLLLALRTELTPRRRRAS